LPYLARAARYTKVQAATTTASERTLDKKLALFPRVTAAFKKLALVHRIQRTKRLFLSRPLSNTRNYIFAIAYAEMSLARYKKVLYFFIKKVLAISASCRLVDPQAEGAISKKEQAVLSAMVPAAREYGALILSYKKLHKKFRNSEVLKTVKTLPQPAASKVFALRRYLLLQSRFFGQKNARAKKEKRLLRAQINPRRQHYFKKGLARLAPFF
jgi:hypothetical protein